jgi:hypothetical protein
MASIEEELALAKQAKAAIEGTLTNEAVEVFRKSYHMAVTQPAFSSEEPLRDARHKVGLALPKITGALGQPSQDDIDDAKSAIELWIEELEASL